MKEDALVLRSESEVLTAPLHFREIDRWIRVEQCVDVLLRRASASV